MLLRVVTSCIIPESTRAVAGRAGLAAAGSRRSRAGPNRTAWPAALSSRANQGVRDAICRVRATAWRPRSAPSPTSRLTQQCPFSRSRRPASVSGASHVRSRRAATMCSLACSMSAASSWRPICTRSKRAPCYWASPGYDVAGCRQPRPGLWHRRARPTPASTSRRGRGLTHPRSGVHARSIGKSKGLFHRLRAPTLHHREPPPSRASAREAARQAARCSLPAPRSAAKAQAVDGARRKDWCKRLGLSIARRRQRTPAPARLPRTATGLGHRESFVFAAEGSRAARGNLLVVAATPT